jgi:hypothetical protein
LYYGLLCRASFELEAGAMGQTTDFKEGTRRLEWNLKKASLKKDLISLLLSIGFAIYYMHALFEDDHWQSCKPDLTILLYFAE